MSAAKALYAKLSADTAISALAGNRIIPDFAPKGELPQIVYELKTIDRKLSHDGPLGLNQQKVVLSCISDDYAEAVSLANAVKDSIQNKRGTWGGVVVQRVFFKDSDEEPFEDAETKLLYHCINQEYDMWFEG